MYKTLLITTFNVLLYIMCSLIIGFFLPIVISLISSISNNIEFTDCIDNPIFWVFSVIFTIAASFYLNDENQLQKP